MREPEVGDSFKDTLGDIWIYVGNDQVKRLKDGIIGVYDNGQGLEAL